MTGSLRERHRQQTTEVILGAVADLLSEEGAAALTVDRVAQRSGVSSRTIYRYFPDRTSLIAGAAQWIEAAYPFEHPSSAGEIAGTFEQLFPVFDEERELNRAIVSARVGGSLPWPQREGRLEAICAALAEVTDRLDPAEAERAKAIVGYLAGGLAWMTLADESGLDGREAGLAVGWAIRVLVADLRVRNEATAQPAAHERVGRMEAK
jgi:AcrR family transcriptional regulator